MRAAVRCGRLAAAAAVAGAWCWAMYWHPNALATSLAAASALVVLCAGIGHYARKRGRYGPRCHRLRRVLLLLLVAPLACRLALSGAQTLELRLHAPPAAELLPAPTRVLPACRCHREEAPCHCGRW